MPKVRDTASLPGETLKHLKLKAEMYKDISRLSAPYGAAPWRQTRSARWQPTKSLYGLQLPALPLPQLADSVETHRGIVVWQRSSNGNCFVLSADCAKI